MSVVTAVPKAIGRGIVRFVRFIIDELEQLADDVSADPVVLHALAADLGVPPERLNIPKAEDRPKLTGIDEYVNSVDAKAEQLIVAAEFIGRYVAFWKDVIKAAIDDGDPSVVADELVYRLFQLVTVNTIKFRYPDTYFLLRLVGVIYQDLRLSVEEAFAPEVPANLFTSEYWKNFGSSFERGYLKFRLDQAADLFLKPPNPGDPPLTPAQIIQRKQLGVGIFGRSDLLILTAGFMFIEWVLRSRLKKLNLDVNHFYGWELPPGPDIPLSERIASRGYTLKLTHPGEVPASSSATLTTFLLADENDRIGWLLSLRGAIVFEEKAGEDDRPIKIKITVDTPDGLDMLVFFSGEDKFKFTGAPTAGMKLSIEPAQPATVGPAFSLPETKGTRLEIGDFSFKVDISTDGFKIKASTDKSALVIVKGEADEFIQETIPPDEVRINFALGLVADQDGIYFEGGNRLSVNIPINFSFLGITVQSITLALNPVTAETGSELQFAAATSFALNLGPLHIVVDQIGLTMNLGTNGETPPEDAIKLLPFLYMRELGFRPPSGVGILVDSAVVTGGGFLFFDRENEQYAGVLQLEIGSRLSLKAIGLLTTRLPDGSKGFSLLIIISVEFDPPLQLPLGFSIAGIGGYLGINRTVDVNVLREGLHNRTLDAILFPKDPVINAPRIINTLRSVFPPARERHLFGLAVIIGWGPKTPLITMKLAVIYEHGDNPRLIILGQIEMIIPSKKPILEIHMDAIGIWDYDKSEFSLDARLYDSRIAFITISGDMAMRVRRGANPFFMLSIGGYHPAFNVPPDFPRLDRVIIKFVDTQNLRLILSGYFAVTSNTRQAGGKIEFFAKLGSVSFEALIQIDVLWEPDVRFLADFDIKIAIKYKGHTLFGAHAVGQFSGPEPKRVKGKVSISLFFFDIEKSFDKTFGDDRPPAQLPSVDPIGDLVAALKDTRSWDAPLPGGSRMLISLSKRPGSGEVMVHPLGSLSVRQQVLPLGIHLERYAGGIPSGAPTFTITQVIIAGDVFDNADISPINEFFAPAEFLEMSDDEKISRPSFESMPAGITLQLGGVSFGGDTLATANQTAVSEMDFDEKIVGANGVATNGQQPGLLSGAFAVAAMNFGAAARSSLRTAGADHFSAPARNFRVSQPDFVVAGVDDLKTAPIGENGTKATGQSFTAVQQALDAHLKANPQAKGRLQVVPAFQAEETE